MCEFFLFGGQIVREGGLEIGMSAGNRPTVCGAYVFLLRILVNGQFPKE